MPSKLSAKAERFDTDLLLWLDRKQGVSDDEGFATRKLMQPFMADYTMDYGQYRLKQIEDAGLIEREKQGKRTYKVMLTEAGQEWVRNRYAGMNGNGHHPEPEAEPVESSAEQVDEPTQDIPEPEKTPEDRSESVVGAVGDVDYSQLAESMIVTVAGYLTKRDETIGQLRRDLRDLREARHDDRNIAQRLSAAMGDVNRLTRERDAAVRELETVKTQLTQANERARHLADENARMESRLRNSVPIKEHLSESDRNNIMKLMTALPESA